MSAENLDFAEEVFDQENADDVRRLRDLQLAYRDTFHTRNTGSSNDCSNTAMRKGLESADFYYRLGFHNKMRVEHIIWEFRNLLGLINHRDSDDDYVIDLLPATE